MVSFIQYTLYQANIPTHMSMLSYLQTCFAIYLNLSQPMYLYGNTYFLIYLHVGLSMSLTTYLHVPICYFYYTSHCSGNYMSTLLYVYICEINNVFKVIDNTNISFTPYIQNKKNQEN